MAGIDLKTYRDGDDLLIFSSGLFADEQAALDAFEDTDCGAMLDLSDMELGTVLIECVNVADLSVDDFLII